LRRALAAASRRTARTRIDMPVDCSAEPPEGRAGVRLSVFDDGAKDSGATADGMTVTRHSLC
jgi:hypothetical protein